MILILAPKESVQRSVEGCRGVAVPRSEPVLGDLKVRAIKRVLRCFIDTEDFAASINQNYA